MSDFSLFSVMGLEIEYMIVDKTTLNIKPISDVILEALHGELTPETTLDDIVLSNELVLHVIELKNNGPKAFDAPFVEHFQTAILKLAPVLSEHHAMLMPSAAHPWMKPHEETVRWPHGQSEIYQQFDSIFQCQGHGWSNLQSMHINLPFANDEEFFKLHNITRLILPLLPSIAASSPYLEGQRTHYLDTRLYYYEHNQKRFPLITGDVIPEFVHGQEDYKKRILNPMYKSIQSVDPLGLLQHEWLNSRGAIPKFAYGALEIRLLDTQEYVTGDIAIARAVYTILNTWINQREDYLEHPANTEALKAIYDASLIHGLKTPIDSRSLKQDWQLPSRANTLRDAWIYLIEQNAHLLEYSSQCALELILHEGNLSERLVRSLGGNPAHHDVLNRYQDLSTHLITNTAFNPK